MLLRCNVRSSCLQVFYLAGMNKASQGSSMLKTRQDLLSPRHKVVTQDCKHIAMGGLGNGPWKQGTSNVLRGMSTLDSLLMTGSDAGGA